MSNVIDNNVLINDILNNMSDKLDSDQLIALKNILCIKLYDLQLTQKCYDLATTDDDNDTKKIERFIISKKVNKLADTSIRQYVRTAKDLRGFINKNFVDITTQDITYYLLFNQQQKHWSDRYYCNQINYLSVFFTFLLDEEYITKNPMRKIKRIRPSKTVKKPFSASELEMIRKACENDLRVLTLVEFLLSSALRVESVSILKWGDLDFKTKSGFVKVKGGDIFKFRYNEKTEFYLSQYLSERMKNEKRSYSEMIERPLFVRKHKDAHTKDYESLSAHGIEYILLELAKKTKIDKLHPHRFRRTFACNALSRGATLEEVKEHLGHKDLRTTLIYAEITDTMKEQSYRKYCE